MRRMVVTTTVVAENKVAHQDVCEGWFHGFNNRGECIVEMDDGTLRSYGFFNIKFKEPYTDVQKTGGINPNWRDNAKLGM